MLHLPSITLVAVGSRKYFEGMWNAIQKSKEGIQWGSVQIIDCLPCNDIDEWNHSIVFRLREFIETDYCMLIHPDGFIVHPESWRDEFLYHDFIGSPWPLPVDNYSYRTPDGEIIRVGNSVSLRSKKMLNMPYELEVGWRSYYGNTNEDGFLTVHNRRLFQHFGVRYAPIEVAKYFGRELDIPENEDVESPFCFHLHDTMPGRNEKYKELIK